MGLIERCRRSLNRNDQANGYLYYRRGKIRLHAGDSNRLVCAVEGSRRTPYQVEIDFHLVSQRKLLVADCDCPRFQDVEICKHVAAVLYFADAERFDRFAPGNRPLRIISAEEADECYPDWNEELTLDSNDNFYEPSPVQPSSKPSSRAKNNRRAAPKAPWELALATVRQLESSRAEAERSRRQRGLTHPIEVWYVVFDEVLQNEGLVIEFLHRERKRNGDFGKLKVLKLSGSFGDQIADPIDRQLLGLLIGNRGKSKYDYYRYLDEPTYERSNIHPSMYEYLLSKLAATGRFAYAKNFTAATEALEPLVWDDGPPWQFQMQFEPDMAAGAHRVCGYLRRGDEAMPLSEPQFIDNQGILLAGTRLARFEKTDSFAWLLQLAQCGPLTIPRAQIDSFVEQLYQLPDGLPPLELPEDLRFATIHQTPQAQLKVLKPKSSYGRKPALCARVQFQYQANVFDASDLCRSKVDQKTRSVVERDLAAEGSLLATLPALGFFQSKAWDAEPGDLEIPQQKLPVAVTALLAAGWKVEAEGVDLRAPGNFSMSVKSGVDWFELDASCDFDGEKIGLPRLLEALKRGQDYVELGDRSHGMLPQEWLRKYSPLASMAEVEGDKLRFRPTQALLLDALLAAQPQADVDAKFRKAREKLQSFSGVTAAAQPAGFVGAMREYQLLGLGWLLFLQDFGFGGCLADDMGLGKTIQVLALLEQQRARRRRSADGVARTSLAVVPKSLVHNWIDEAIRFTPKLRVLNYTGLGRASQLSSLADYDLVLTTYGTLRRDIAALKDIHFNLAILDEAQAIKNATSDSAKACRLITAQHRLAMTGTPVENHLGELWSLFEFLNPGMLGRAEAFKRFSTNTRGADRETLELLAKAVRPYLLRRTKQQVLTELPEKTEQTLYCDLEGQQRKLYDELREHYRQLLSKKIGDVGLKRAKIHVLEALLRLRQAACHPGLVDKQRGMDSSAKLELLLEQLELVLDEGHKALVFSQFTSLLAIVRRRLDERQIAYEYLDGKTRDRKSCVERFQQQDASRVFLISLKAGGLGLNLTAADYVFILDPWWNPAVEAQAVDRAHRIGQARNVTAYRVIARDTVEEKIMQLQASKRDLADAIVSADNSVIGALTAEDLQLLLS